MRPEAILALLLLTLPLLAACPSSPDDDDVADDDDAAPVDFRLWSDDFVSTDTLDSNPYEDECVQALPPEFSCGNSNPELSWEGAPEGTVAFALIFDDPTAGGFPHWAIYNIPGDSEGLDAAISGNAIGNDPPGDALELDNGFGFNGYVGSCPGGINMYRWRPWALSAELDTPASASYPQLAEAAEEVAIDMVDMCHVFDGANADN